LAFRFFSRADRWICLYSSISSSSVSAPGRDHFVQVLRGGAHRIELRLPATFLCGNVEAECLAVSRNRQRLVRFEVAREILAEFTDANLHGFHIVYSLYTSTATRYGYFRDALYYLACAEHLDFGYVDLPPLFPAIAWIARHTLGTSLPALLFWPALAGGARIVLIAAFARELGARRFGTVLAATLAATPGVWWVIDHQFAMNALEPLLWTGCAYTILLLIKTKDPKLWLAFGTIAGVGLENKYSIVIFAFALLAGLLLTPQRRLLFTPWLLAGGAAALVIFLPNLIWNIQHHWPFLEVMHNIRITGKDIVLPPGAYIGQQILMMNPLSFPFWFGGLLFYFSRAGHPFRAFGWAFVITIALLLALHGKDYYSAPAYALVLAAGAVATERLLESWRRPQGAGDPEAGVLRLAANRHRADSPAGVSGFAVGGLRALPVALAIPAVSNGTQLCRRRIAAILRG
jgi:4-amino-4-deoxy-L-arabinose transferase-like glycosyltransferase